MKLFKIGRCPLIAFILSGCLLATGCPKKTTLDRIGAITIASVNAYIGQLDGLKAQGVLSDVKHGKLTTQALAIRVRAEQFRVMIDSIAEIKPGDARAILSITSDLLNLIDASLRDSDIAKLPDNSGALKSLRYARLGISQAQLALAILFPEPTPGVSTPAGARVPVRSVSPKKIVVELQ